MTLSAVEGDSLTQEFNFCAPQFFDFARMNLDQGSFLLIMTPSGETLAWVTRLRGVALVTR